MEMNRDRRRKVGSVQDGRAYTEACSSAKPHPFFSNVAARKEEALLPASQRPTVKMDAPPTVEHFLHLDPFASSVQHSGASSSRKKVKIAMYDLDGTLIEPKSGAKFPKDGGDWKWWHAKVKPKLAEAYEQGFVNCSSPSLMQC